MHAYKRNNWLFPSNKQFSYLYLYKIGVMTKLIVNEHCGEDKRIFPILAFFGMMK